MHEEEDVFVLEFCQGALEPAEPFLAERAVAGAVDQAVEHDALGLGQRHDVLHEARIVGRHLGKGGMKGGAVVVVADHEVVGHRQRLQHPLQRRIGRGLAPVGEVAGDEDRVRVEVVRLDRVHRCVQPIQRVKPIEFAPGRH